MPQFIIECPDTLVNEDFSKKALEGLYEVAAHSGLFDPANVKVRIQPYAAYTVHNQQQDFIHVFGNIMGGRTDEQKKKLSHGMVAKLKMLFPQIGDISMNVIDFHKASYCNLSILEGAQ